MSEPSERPHQLALVYARPLAPLTTLKLGGPAAEFVIAERRETVLEALAHVRTTAQPLHILGGGSNVVVADAGVPGLVLQMATRGIELSRGPAHSVLTVQAGETWDDIVQLAIDERLAGIECLTGIPGSAGAVPIQNVGAYGQEVSDVIEAVELLDRMSGLIAWHSAADCAFRYRDSRLKREPEHFVVLAVRMLLRTGGLPTVRYGELARALALAGATPSLSEVQLQVRALRKSKGMLLGADYEPSAGSFFTNPIVTLEQVARVTERALANGAIAEASELPQFPAEPGQVKLAAGWLIEHAGISKGLRVGAVGVSSRHALALVHHGNGSTRELLALAQDIQQRVELSFGLRLELEPVRWGV